VIRLLGGLCVAYLCDVTIRESVVASKAQRLAKQMGRPLLNVGSGTATSSATGAKLRGQVNCDLAAKGNMCGPRQVCFCNIERLPFRDKQFGVALALNVMPYVPNKRRALAELHRVADVVIVSSNVLPWPQIGAGPTMPVRSRD
jgi:ubiquinone/menaquinone biosynthesis C-methylase UbiE